LPGDCPEARQVVADLDAALQVVDDLTARYFAIGQSFSDLLRPIAGVDGSDLPNADRVGALRRDVGRYRSAGFPEPVPRSVSNVTVEEAA
jgi:hypothetical protein